MIHDKCDATIFGPSFECELTEDETEPKMECIEDCGITKYICDCNVYRYFFIFQPGLNRTVLVLGRPPVELQPVVRFFVQLIRKSKSISVIFSRGSMTQHVNGKPSRILIAHWMQQQLQRRHIQQRPQHRRLQILQRLQLQQKLQQQHQCIQHLLQIQQRPKKIIPLPQLNQSGIWTTDQIGPIPNRQAGYPQIPHQRHIKIKTQEFMKWNFRNFRNQRI